MKTILVIDIGLPDSYVVIKIKNKEDLFEYSEKFKIIVYETEKDFIIFDTGICLRCNK